MASYIAHQPFARTGNHCQTGVACYLLLASLVHLSIIYIEVLAFFVLIQRTLELYIHVIVREYLFLYLAFWSSVTAI
jgi:hypothetical protein